MGGGCADALLECDGFEFVGGDALKVTEGPAGGDERPAFPVFVAGDDFCTFGPVFEELESGGGDAAVALALGAEAVPVGDESWQAGSGSVLGLAVASVDEGHGVSVVSPPDVEPSAHG